MKDSIDYDLLQGYWAAYQLRYIAEYTVASKTTGKPEPLEIEENTYRFALWGSFYPFTLDNNLIIFNKENNQVDSACIHLITDRELTISFKRGIDYEEYHYER